MPPRGLTPERLVDAAATIADRDGYDAVTLSAVAAEVGVRTPSLYNHVDGLAGLRRGLALRAVDELGDRLRRAAVGRSGGDAVASLALAYRAFATERPGLYAATVPAASPADEASAVVARAAAEVVDVVVAVLAGFGLEGEEAIHATRALRSLLHGFTSLELAGGFGLDVDVDASARWMVERFVAGLQP